MRLEDGSLFVSLILEVLEKFDLRVGRGNVIRGELMRTREGVGLVCWGCCNVL